MNKITKQFIYRVLKFIAFWVILGLLIYLIGHFLYLFLPFIIAFILTTAINPLKRLFVKKFRLPVGISVLLAMILELGALGTIFTLLVLKIISEIQDVYAQWPYIHQQIQTISAYWLTKIETAYLQLPSNYVDAINNTVNGFINSIPRFLTAGISFAVTIPEIIIIIVIALVATYFMSKGSQRYIGDFIKIFPFEWRESLIELGRDFAKAFSGFVKAELIVFLITLACSIFGLIIIKTKYAVILGTITGIFGILPVLGVGIILVPWAIFAVLSGHTLLAIELVILTSIITILRHTIEPKILGENVGLDPLFVLMSIYIGLAATGIIGLVLGPFVLIAYKALEKAGVFRNL